MKTLNTSNANGSIKRNRRYKSQVFTQALPVIKLSLEGILLSANNTGVDFLDMLSDYTKAPAINRLLKTYPSILDAHSNFDFKCRVYDTNYYFSAVAFKEAGFIGIYGYRLVHVTHTDNKLAS